MESFRAYLQREFVRRSDKNPNYSLRAYANSLKVNHATLSTILSGKRKITDQTVLKLAQALTLGPQDIETFLSQPEADREQNEQYYLIQQDAFELMSEWHFDGILEMSLIPHIKLTPTLIAEAFGISAVKAQLALETLERLNLLSVDKQGRYKLTHKDTTNILDPDMTSAAQIKHQKGIIEKSLDVLESVPREKRDHTSTTIAMDIKDLPETKKRIQKFRQDLNKFLQRKKAQPNQVYQLQVAFFPLTDLAPAEKRK
jgi:uncharacterized protein (TIGR02147 family)